MYRLSRVSSFNASPRFPLLVFRVDPPADSVPCDAADCTPVSDIIGLIPGMICG